MVTIDKIFAEADESPMSRPLPPALKACAAALILAHLLVLATAGIPAFHEWIHGHSDAHHECAAMAYLGGQLDQVAPTSGPGATTWRIAGNWFEPAPGIAETATIFSRERAPPVG